MTFLAAPSVPSAEPSQCQQDPERQQLWSLRKLETSKPIFSAYVFGEGQALAVCTSTIAYAGPTDMALKCY